MQKPPTHDLPAPTVDLIDLPDALRGDSLSQITLSTPGLGLMSEIRCSSQLDIDHGWRMPLVNRCSGRHLIV